MNAKHQFYVQNFHNLSADDMGLGKTLTMISLILKQKQAEGATKEQDKKKTAWLNKKGTIHVLELYNNSVC